MIKQKLKALSADAQVPETVMCCLIMMYVICVGNCREREEGKPAVDVCSDNCIQVHNVRVSIYINTTFRGCCFQ